MRSTVRSYKTRSIVIQSVLLTNSNVYAVAKWCKGKTGHLGSDNAAIELDVSDGSFVAEAGDYIIKYPDGEHDVMSAEQFTRLFNLTDSELEREGDMWPEHQS